MTEETKIKISKALLGLKRPPFSEEHRKNLRIAHLNQKGIWKNKKLSAEHKRKLSISHIGKKSTEEHKKNISLSLKNAYLLKKLVPRTTNIKTRKENHWNWKGGISLNPYPKEFNIILKRQIRERDNFTCCLCGRTEREELEELNRVLCVNHIDFNKENCKSENLNTLCVRCNIKINRDRDYWLNYFQRS